MLLAGTSLASGQLGSVRGVGHVPAEPFDLGAQGVGAAQSRAARASVRASTRAVTSAGTASDGATRGLVPDTIEVETEDRIGVQDQPAPFVVGDRRSQDLAQQGQGDRHVEVVVDRGNEAVMEGPALGRQGSGGRAGAVA